MDQELPGGIKTSLETAIDARDNQASRNDTSTETAHQTKRGRGRPRKTENRTEENGISGLASVSDEPLLVSVALPGEDKPEEQPKKKAGRPKKTSAKKSQIDSTSIQAVLLTVSALVSSRPGMEVWNLTAEESRQIADPLANILAKNEAIGNAIGEHADAFALITACFVVFLPKTLMYMASKPKKPKQGDTVNYGTKQPAQPTNQERENRSITQSNVRPSANRPKTGHQNFSGQLSSIISPVGGF